MFLSSDNDHISAHDTFFSTCAVSNSWYTCIFTCSILISRYLNVHQYQPMAALLHKFHNHCTPSSRISHELRLFIPGNSGRMLLWLLGTLEVIVPNVFWGYFVMASYGLFLCQENCMHWQNMLHIEELSKTANSMVNLLSYQVYLLTVLALHRPFIRFP